MIGVVALPVLFLGGRLPKSRALLALSLFVYWALLVSLVWFMLDMNMNSFVDWRLRLLGFTRQLSALFLGISVFVVVRSLVLYVAPAQIIWLMLTGIIPAALVALLNTWYLVSGLDPVAEMVYFIRKVVVPLGYHDPIRVSGLSSEPAHYGLFLGGYALPVMFAAWDMRIVRRTWLLGAIAAILLTVLFTNSATGLMAVFLCLLTSALIGLGRRLSLALGAGVLAALVYFVSSGNAWYLEAQLEKILRSGNPSMSATTRLFSTIGPLTKFPEKPWLLVGVGLGGTSVHLDDLVPEVVVQDIREVSYEDQPGLKTLWGKIVAETGVFGAILFGAFGLEALKGALFISRIAHGTGSSHIGKSAVSALTTLLLIHAIGFGAYTFPYLWLWAGLADGFGVIGRRQIRC